MVNYFITVWMALNCIGKQLGTMVLSKDQCFEPKFGLAFRTNGTYLTVTGSCQQLVMLNTVKCGVSEGCCYIPDGLSVNITETDLQPQTGQTKFTYLPEASPGRTFICIEQPIL